VAASILVTDPAAARELAAVGQTVELAEREVLARAQALRPDVVVLDGGPGAPDLCRRLKAQAKRDGVFLPVLVLVAPGRAVEALKAGAEDALTRPYDAAELIARVESLVRTRRQFDEASRSQAEEEEWAIHDRLTGLPNGRYLTQRIDEEFRRAARFAEPLALLAIDLDGLEDVNGRFGRGAGDKLLEACARAIVAACREIDLVARAGGDEFVVVLPAATLSLTLGTAERIAQRIGGMTIEGGVGCQVSIGVASFPGRDVATPRDLLRAAHGALARAKAEGRGRICVYQHQGYLLGT
jgi:diguanylate cyclase (GGDEF)-like protein